MEGTRRRAGRLMQHAHTRALYDYWTHRRRDASAPRRADIAPQDIAGLLGHLFILQRFDAGHHVFRLAGTGLCELYQREFRDQNFSSLWRPRDADLVRALLEAVVHDVEPASALARAATLDGREMEIELSFLPLRGPDGAVDRILGLFQPFEDIRTLRGRPLVRTALREARPPEASLDVLAASRGCADTALQFAANDR